MRYRFEHIMPGPYEFRPGQYSDEEVRALWPQAAAELAGFADHLAAEASGITAGQLRMALHLAERMYRQLSEDFPP